MTATYETGVRKLDGYAPSRSIGLASKSGGLCINDQPFTRPGTTETQLSAYLHIQNGGNVLCKNQDGFIEPFLGVPNGAFIICVADTIVSSAILNDGNTYTTTATGVTWHGGQ